MTHAPSSATSLASVRVDQVGSLLRPEGLKAVFTRYGLGQATDDELRQAQDDAIREVVARQEAHGAAFLTDGEFRRLQFQESFGNSVAGFASSRGTIQFYEQRNAGGAAGQRFDVGTEKLGPAISQRTRAVERLRLAYNQPLHEYRFTRSVATRPVKVSLISMDRIIERFDLEGSRDVYGSMEAFIADAVAVERQIVGELAAAGCPYVQIDAPGYTDYVDEKTVAQMRARGEDPMARLDRSIAAENAVIVGFDQVTFGIHTCRGNQRSMWHREGAYDPIAERLFSGLAHQRLLLEYDDARSGGFEPLRFVPKGKTVVLGLVSSKQPRLESPDDLKRRIDAAARYLPLEQLALSPQCGFASNVFGNLLSEDDQWRKFDLIHQVALDVWGHVGP